MSDKMKRNTLLLTILALTAFLPWNEVDGQVNTTVGGRFDWVRTFTGRDNSDGTPVNEILGSVMDREGNVYILGQFIGDAHWDNGTDNATRILPFSPQGHRSALIAKFSPDGNRVWHKEFYSSYSDLDAWTIRMKGDSAIMVYVNILYPFNYVNETNELYYLDRLYVNPERFPIPPDSLRTGINGANALITLSLDGHVIEEHFFYDVFVKSDGSLLRNNIGNDYLETSDAPLSFNIDSEGNILMIRRTNDVIGQYCDTCPDGHYIWSPTEGNISHRRMVIDGGAKQLDIPLGPSTYWNWQIIKLSPHLDSVIASTYIFDRSTEFEPSDPNEFIEMYLQSFDIDANDNIYLSLYRHQARYLFLPIKNSDSIYMEWEDCVLRYSPDLMPTGIVQTPTTYIPSGHPAGDIVWLSTILDTTTNSLFLMGFAGRDTTYATFIYDGDTLNLVKNACWMRLDADDLSLISYGKARAANYCNWRRTYMLSDKWLRTHNGSFAVADNRVFVQVKFQNNILFQDTMINRSYGLGLFVWDYDGHELAYIDYNSSGIHDKQGYIHLKDSSVWVSGTVTSEADFGSFHINSTGNSCAYLAHYTDTTFLKPYVHDTTSHGGEVHITVVGDEKSFVAYPNPFRQRVTIETKNGETLAETAWLTDLTGHREQVRLTAEGTSLYTLDLSSRPQATYLLTLTTASGKTHTVRLMKMSDIFSL